MRLKTMCSAMVIALTVGVGQAVAQTRYDVGLLLGATRTSDEGAALAVRPSDNISGDVRVAHMGRIEGGHLPRSAVPRVARVHSRRSGRNAPQGVRCAVSDAWRPSDGSPQWARVPLLLQSLADRLHDLAGRPLPRRTWRSPGALCALAGDDQLLHRLFACVESRVDIRHGSLLFARKASADPTPRRAARR